MKYIYLLWPFSPISIAFLYALIGLIKRINLNILFVLLAVTLALLNYTRTPTSDLAEYYLLFDSLNGTNIIDFFTYVRIDFLFYFFSMLIVKLFGNVNSVLLFWTFFSYFIYFKSLQRLNSRYAVNSNKILILVIFFSFTLGLLFNHSSHLVRQFAALSLMIYSIVLADLKDKNAKWYFIASGLIHFSTLVFLPLLFIKNDNKKLNVLIITLLLIILFFIGNYNILLILSDLFKETSYIFLSEIMIRINMYIFKNDGNIMLGAYVKMCLFALLSFILYLYSNKYNFISISFIYLIMLLLLFRNTDLVLIRYFFYAQFYYGIFIFIFLKEVNNKFLNRSFLLYALYGIMKFFFNIQNSGWKYIANDFSLLYLNIFDYLLYWR